MKTMCRRLAIITSAILVLFAVFVNPVIADDSPESITISNVMAFRNLAESGDVLIMFHYDMAYSSDNWSDVPASTGIILRLQDDSGNITQTGNPYVYPYFETNGYGDGNGAFYLTATDNYTWGIEAVINILTSPTLTPYTINSYTLTIADYTTEETQAENRASLADYILLECDSLEAIYDDTGIVLKTTSDAGIILSPYGEAYYQGVVTGISSLVPELFFIQSSVPEMLDTSDYDLLMGDTIAARTDADDMGEGFANTAALFHLNKYAFWLIIVGIVTIAACFITIRKEWGIEPGLAIGSLVFSGLAFIVGGMIFGVIMLCSFVAIISVVWILILKRA